jgi:hypothetical protein
MVAGSRNLLIEKILGLRWLDLNQRVFGREPKGWFLSRGGNRSEHFRCCFARGIRGTRCMRSHICLHHATTKYFSNSFVFKNKIEKEGLPRDSRLGRRGLSSNLGAPTIYFFVFNALFLMLQRQKLGSKYKPLHAFYCTTLLFRNRVQINFARDLRCGVPRTVPASFLLECLRYQASARGCASNAAFAVIGHAYCGGTPLRRRGIGRYSTVGWCRTGCG